MQSHVADSTCSAVHLCAVTLRDMLLEVAAYASVAGKPQLSTDALTSAAFIGEAAARMEQVSFNPTDLEEFFALFRKASEPIGVTLAAIQSSAETEDGEVLERVREAIALGGGISSLCETITELCNTAQNLMEWPSIETIRRANQRIKAKRDFEAGLKSLLGGEGRVINLGGDKGIPGILGGDDED